MNSTIKFIVSLFLILSVFGGLSLAQLSQLELDSVNFIIQFYGQPLPQDQSVCGYAVSSSYVRCDNQSTDGQYHVRQISLEMSTSGSVGIPNPDLTGLYLPALLQIKIFKHLNFANTNVSMNIMDYIKPLKTLTSIYIIGDVYVVIPPDFSDWPNLADFYLENNGITAIPHNFLNNSVQLQSYAIKEKLESFTYDDSLYFPSLNKLLVHSDTSVGLPYLFNLTSKSFPALTDIELVLIGYSTPVVHINIWNLDQDLTVHCFGYRSNNCDLRFSSPNRITTLILTGTITPIITKEFYPSLKSLSYTDSNLTQFPFASYPLNMTFIDLTNNQISTIPNVPMPKGLEELRLKKNLLSSFDIDNLFTMNQALKVLQFDENPSFAGPITDAYCSHGLSILNTPVPDIPDCFWCYFNETGPLKRIYTSIPFPYPFVCDGNNLGWGTLIFTGAYRFAAIKPNKIIAVTLAARPFVPTPATVKWSTFAGAPQTEFTFLETGSDISITGNFGSLFNRPLVDFMNGTTLISECTVKSISTNLIVCRVLETVSAKQINVSVTVDSYNTVYQLSLQQSCQQSTINCHGNGQCDVVTGQCICNSNAFYNNCSNPYPILSSGSYNATNNKIVSLNGDFGPFGQSNLSIKINNTLDCTVVDKSQTLITCTLEQTPNYGLSSVQLQLDSLDTNAKDILYLRQPDNGGNNGSTTTSTSGGTTTDTPQQQCEKQTSNCYGHGICDIHGICQCDKDYNLADNCFTKFINTTITPNTTSPTVSFDIDGIDFQFEVVSIQELDFDSNIIKELFISNYTWIVNASTNNITTIVDYQLNTTLSASSSSDINSILFQSVSVLSTISFSTQSRDIQFGDQLLHINPNSIKLAVNVGNWQYSSNLATLRVVFRTIIINNQTVEYDCNEKDIDALSYDSMSSLQYLRVIKDDIQFNGRFIDVALSDGRPTYSQTQLISLAQSTSNEDESIALIGINLPQCQSCVLDPDFSPLLIDKSNDSGCNKSNTWRIIVGCVVGGVGAVAITVGSVLTYKQIKKRNTYNNQMAAKLKNIS
ncbi:hypothetical protein DFA_09614 [Cavenderia fasciculata]|uniref:ComC supersandwich domain-containing protein n=1 Tax=Cavenderia fasciculata TaxID=261658 RepID=F4Q843_CACFS|nr:uncharacterized protein DFA_09614 [Cavenderia fasciculata]EGG15943.1 hypothetical protein DFA_09614 [Cavenderia fasciculata]|eukprot:XP_004352268.1 hypothetical protein DFA_09614 [Cavenderia fasciculata]